MFFLHISAKKYFFTQQRQNFGNAYQNDKTLPYNYLGTFRTSPNLVAEVADAGEYHRHAMLVGGLDGFVVADRAAGLDYCRYARLGGEVNAVAEGEEGVGG